MKPLISLVIPVLMSASLFAAAPQAPRAPQAPDVSETPRAKKSSLSILVLSKTGCEPCRRLADELKSRGNDIPWDIWKDAPLVEAKYGGVTAYPTILLLKDGKEISRRVGYTSVEELNRWMDDPTAAIRHSGDYCLRTAPTPHPAAISRYYAPAAGCST